MRLDAYEKEIVLYAKELVGYLIKSGASEQDAQDIAQDALLKILEIDESLAADKIKPWLFRVGINLYYNLYNRKKRYQEILTVHFNPNFEAVIEVDYDHLYEILSELDLKTVNLLLMKYEQELSFKEIAFILGRPEGSLKTELYRARKKCKMIAERMEQNDR